MLEDQKMYVVDCPCVTSWFGQEATLGTKTKAGRGRRGPWLGSLPSPSTWADLGEDQIINPVPGFWQIFGPLGPTAGPRIVGNGPAQS